MQREKIKKVKKGDITTDTMEIQRIIQTHFNNLYPTELENLKAVNSFLYIYHLSKVNQDQVNKSNRPITPSEIEAVIISFPTKKHKA